MINYLNDPVLLDLMPTRRLSHRRVAQTPFVEFFSLPSDHNLIK